MEVLWLKEAIQDLKEIGQFITADDSAAAYRVLTKIETSGNSLLYGTRLGRPGRVKLENLSCQACPISFPITSKVNRFALLLS